MRAAARKPIQGGFMITQRILTAALLSCAAAGWMLPAAADTADAMCEVRKDGDVKEGRSGPCDFSQRQGYIRMDLRNGETWDLRPGNQANEYRDQKGNKVKRSFEGDAQVYKWEHKKIVVTFPRTYQDDRHRHQNRHSYGPTPHGQTPPELSDLVEGRYVGGEVADEMQRRGYRSIRDSVSGSDVYSYYEGHGNCVTVRLDRQRRVRSIVSGPEFDCRQGHSGSAGSSSSSKWDSYPRLVGAASDGAVTQLQMNGFHQVDTFDSGRNAFGTVWYNRSNRQCLQVIIVNGRVDSANDIQTHPKCR